MGGRRGLPLAFVGVGRLEDVWLSVGAMVTGCGDVVVLDDEADKAPGDVGRDMTSCHEKGERRERDEPFFVMMMDEEGKQYDLLLFEP